MPGYCGKVLWVNLSERTWQEEIIPDEVYRRQLAGGGLGVHLLLERIPAGADPLGPENILGFVAGILVGTGAMFAGRWMVVGKSTLTGGWGDSNCGGNFAPAIKQCGYDGIFISGISPAPVYLLIDGQMVQFLPGADLWGRDGRVRTNIDRPARQEGTCRLYRHGWRKALADCRDRQ